MRAGLLVLSVAVALGAGSGCSSGSSNGATGSSGGDGGSGSGSGSSSSGSGGGSSSGGSGGSSGGTGYDGAAPPPPAQTCSLPAKPVDVSKPTTVVGTGTAASCTEGALASAIAAGGIVTFDCGAAPVTV